MSEPMKKEMLKEFEFLSGGRLCDAEYAYSKTKIEKIKLIHEAIRRLIKNMDKGPKITANQIDIYANQIAHSCDKFKSWDALKLAIKNRIIAMFQEAGQGGRR